MAITRACAFLSLLLPTLAVWGEAGKSESKSHPNVIFAFSDEHRWQSMSFTETPELKTPTMDRLAKEGASFKACISNNPLCVPARTMIMTGKWPYATRALENNGAVVDAENQPTLGKVFHAAGYLTCYIGKWHIGMRPESAGFDRTLVWENTNHHWKSFYRDGDGKTVRYDGYNAVGMTDQALDFIGESAKGGQPFLVMVAWNLPHATFTDPPDDTKALYPKEALRFRPNYQGKSKNKASDLDNYQGYCGHITAIDRELGRLLRRLDELKLAENTIVVYTSDHGSMFGEHGKSSKRHPEEESIRVPFLARWPGRIPAGARLEQLFGTIDIFPTLCGLAAIPAPASCAGMDFAPALWGRPMAGPESQFIMHISNKKEYDKVADDPKARVFREFFRGVRTPRYTYAVGVNGPWLLFDNEKDPYQLKNLIGDPSCEPARAACQAQLDAWLEKAEYSQMPPDLRSKVLSLSLPDRIAWQNIEAVKFSKAQRDSGLAVEGE